MCKIGDIIIINKFKNEDGVGVERHPFIVISTENDIIESISMDMVAVLMSSIKSEEHKKKQLSYKVNLEVTKEAGAKVDSYVKGNQLYCFQRENTDFFKVGTVAVDLFMQLKHEIEEFAKSGKAIYITTNLEKQDDLSYEEELELVK